LGESPLPPWHPLGHSSLKGPAVITHRLKGPPTLPASAGHTSWHLAMEVVCSLTKLAYIRSAMVAAAPNMINVLTSKELHMLMLLISKELNMLIALIIKKLTDLVSKNLNMLTLLISRKLNMLTVLISKEPEYS
jgi:hypothetical protein